MNHIKQLTSDIFSEYQDKPVPIARWVVKTENSGGQIVLVPDRGLLLYYTRMHTRKCEEHAYTHIWLCGVKRECRRQGVLRSMLRSILNDPNCQETISVHLNRKKFPEMIAVLEKLGFKWVEDIARKNLERFEIDADLLKKRLSPF
jgi:ribosomal protein S18 acetylase RimI-like enzyme